VSVGKGKGFSYSALLSHSAAATTVQVIDPCNPGVRSEKNERSFSKTLHKTEHTSYELILPF
jgi:hypothetical protein